jgi:hypothetical protein
MEGKIGHAASFRSSPRLPTWSMFSNENWNLRHKMSRHPIHARSQLTHRAQQLGFTC